MRSRHAIRSSSGRAKIYVANAAKIRIERVSHEWFTVGEVNDSQENTEARDREFYKAFPRSQELRVLKAFVDTENSRNQSRRLKMKRKRFPFFGTVSERLLLSLIDVSCLQRYRLTFHFEIFG